MKLIKNVKYNSFEEYRKDHPKKDKLTDEIARFSLREYGYIEVLQFELTEKGKEINKEVRNFFKEEEKLVNNKAGDKVRYKGLEKELAKENHNNFQKFHLSKEEQKQIAYHEVEDSKEAINKILRDRKEAYIKSKDIFIGCISL